jgi:hypothetical protein
VDAQAEREITTGRYSDKPLAYNVAWKTLIYVLVPLPIHDLERLVDFWRQAGSLVAGNRQLLAEIVWPHFWAIQILLAVLILMYCTMHETHPRDRQGQGARHLLRGAAEGTRLTATGVVRRGAGAPSLRVKPLRCGW